MSRKLVSFTFAAATFVAAFASPAVVSSASAQWPGQFSYSSGFTADVLDEAPEHVVPVFNDGYGRGYGYGPPRGYGRGYYAAPPPRYYGYQRRWQHRQGPPPWAYGPPRHRGYGW